MSYKKYYVYKQQYSEDGGITWKDTDPLVTSPSGDPIGEYATLEECQGIAPSQYRWVNMDPSTDYYCEGTTKYYKQKKQVSYDGGQTWQDVVPAEYQKGDVAEEQSTDCGYVPPTPTGKKLVATYNDGITREVECNGDRTLTTGETRPSGYQEEKMISAVIGDCVTTIGDGAFADYFYGLTSVNIPDSVTNIAHGAFHNVWSLTRVNSSISGVCNIPNSVINIGDSAFHWCDSLTSVNIPTGVTSIGNYAFYHCSGLTSVTVNTTTPPTLGYYSVFSDTNNCPIYVPASSVNAYKTATNWSRYASRIQPIP